MRKEGVSRSVASGDGGHDGAPKIEQYRGAGIAIVDDEESVCQVLMDILTVWGMDVESVSNPLSIEGLIKENCPDVFLLDVYMPQKSGLDLVPEIVSQCPDTKIIIMTGHADKETAIRAMKSGAFDFLEKPFSMELLSHTVCRALETLETERNRRKLVEDLKASETQLRAHKEQLEFLNRQLVETNKALSVLAQNIEREREETERRIAMKLKGIVIPAIEKLMNDKSLVKYGNELYMLVSQIEDLTSGFATDARIASILSFTELRIASLIKNGLTSDEIAKQLHISASTVRTHRKNIRRKLKINDGRFSLRNFLLSKSSGASGR